jgi:predicted acylesterase/phospholipase RssA
MEHIVISSSGPNGLIQIGMLQHLIETSYFSMDTIQSIRGTSAGAILAVLLCLKIPIQVIIDYIIQRPLYKLFTVDVLQFMKTNGVMESSCFKELLAPLFYYQNVSLEITMKELFELTSIELHLFTTALTRVEAVDINHITFPDLPVITAIAMSSAVPILFPPIHYNDEYYIDGGVLTHCPLPPNDKTIVLCINNTSLLKLDSPFHLMYHILIHSLGRVSNETMKGKLFIYDTDDTVFDIVLWEKVILDETSRIHLIQKGYEYAKINL